ncbi:MAG: hypothetical protein QOK42_2080 [Frankiaceae bacterium]|nr:hypothetical protein [Frankiaceae bacterium]MDX6274847.1 hypothetical protein [Frankiales bacterium]
MAALLALLSSLLWGTSDFLGGTATRRRPAGAVVAASQLVALLAVAVAVTVAAGWRAPNGYLVPGVLAGLVGLIALSAFYAALAAGRMGVVAAISALGLLVPVGVGLSRGDRPAIAQLVGMVVAAAGAVCASGPEWRGGLSRRPLLLAGVAALGFGTVQVAVAEGSKASIGMTLLSMRLAAVVPLLGMAVAKRTKGGLQTADLPLLAVIGLADLTANGAYAQATTTGLLSVVAVLGSLYPAVTVVLARVVHQERLRRVQDLGIAATLVGVALIASGG